MLTTIPPIYSTVNRVNSLYPAIGSVSNITSAIVAEFIGGVDASINAAISARYDIPLAVECPILADLSTRETIYRIAVQRMLIHFPPAQQGKHPLQYMHDEYVKTLEAIASGKLDLIDSSGQVISPDSEDRMQFYHNKMGYLQTMNEGPVEAQGVDPLKLDDIANGMGGV